MMRYAELLDALKKLRVETGSLACMGCGHEHNCSTQGCAILRDAITDLELSLTMRCQNCDYWTPGDPRCMNSKSQYAGRVMQPYEVCSCCSIDLLAKSEEARSDLGKRLAKAEQELSKVKVELDAASNMDKQEV